MKQLATSTDKFPQVVAAKQLKSGDISIHATNAAEANQLKDNSEAWVQRYRFWALGRGSLNLHTEFLYTEFAQRKKT